MLEQRRISLSRSALDEVAFYRLADAVLTRPGDFAACGELKETRVCHLANFALEGHFLFLGDLPGISSGQLDPIQTQLSQRGYRFRNLRFDSPEKLPEKLAFLYLGGADLASIRAVLDILYPRVIPGGIVVVDGMGHCHSELRDFGATDEVEGAPVVDPKGQTFTWWVKEVFLPVQEEPLPPRREGQIVVLTYPNLPCGKLRGMLDLAGYRVTNDLEESFSLAMKCNGETFTPRDEPLVELATTTQVINIDCEDVSKSTLEEWHKRAFGYGALIDPTRFRGTCVKKANLNARCRESLVECPIPEAEDSFVYQKLIPTPSEPKEFEEYRVPITGPEIPLVVVKRRTLDRRFDRCSGHAILKKASDIFSAAEITRIFDLIELAGLDFGDLDIMRDARDGRIHVIDINPTPGGPGHYGYTEDQRSELLSLQLACFQRVFLTNTA